jgi:hypothetical protein
MRSEALITTGKGFGKTIFLLQCLAIVVLFASLFLFSPAISPIVTFSEESIALYVHPDSLEVQAKYVFTNPWSFPVRQSIILPFPVDSRHPMPDDIELTLSSTGEPIPARRCLNSYAFCLNFRPKEIIEVSLSYMQKSCDHTASYILTSTHSWQKPLRYGSYSLHKMGVTDLGSNYALKVDKAGGSFERENFMPVHDWKIQWGIGK